MISQMDPNSDASTTSVIRLLNTRPEPMGKELDDLCLANQIDTTSAPIITTVPLADENLIPFVSKINSTIIDPDYLWLFISRTAVRHFAQFVKLHNIAFFPLGRVIAVGPGSRDELSVAFSNLAEQIICPVSANSESLIRLDELNTEQAIKAIIIKGQGGRDLIADHIKQAGGSVIEFDLYLRQVTHYEKTDVVNWTTNDAILVTSIDIANGLFDNANLHLSESQLHSFKNDKTWIVISDRICERLIQFGVTKEHIRVTEKTDNLSIIQQLNQLQGTRSMTQDNNPKNETIEIADNKSEKANKDVSKLSPTETDKASQKTPADNDSVKKSEKSDQALKKLEKEIRDAANKTNQPSSNKKTAPSKDKEKSEKAKDTDKNKSQTGSAPAAIKATNQINHSVQRVSKTAIFALLVSLLAIGAIGFVWWQGQMWLKTQSQVETLNQQAVNNNVAELQKLQTQLNQTNAKLASQLNQSRAEASSIKALANRVKELGQAQPNEWLASEALYLVNLAERKLVIDQDVNTALMLLANASNRLTAMNDPTVFPIRKSISADIAKLHGTAQPDRDAIYLGLSGIIDQINSLPLSHFYSPEVEKVIDEPSVSNDVNDWQSNLATSFRRFMENFVTIKHHDVDIQPQVSIQQQWFVRANISRQLLLAQQSVLQQNNALYNDSIVRTINWMQQYFDLTDPQVVAAVNTLSELQSRNVELTLPTQLASQAELANYVMRQQSRITGDR